MQISLAVCCPPATWESVTRNSTSSLSKMWFHQSQLWYPYCTWRNNKKCEKNPYLIYNYICQKLQETAELSYLKPTSSSQMQGYWIMYHYWSKLNKDIICCPIYIHPPNRETLYSPEPQPLDFLLFPIHLMSLLCLNLTSLFVANYAMWHMPCCEPNVPMGRLNSPTWTQLQLRRKSRCN